MPRGVRWWWVFAAVILTPSAGFAGHRFHASALALAGDGAAAVSSAVLPPGGGRSESIVDAYDDGFVRFGRAWSRVSGERQGGVAITVSEVVITDLDIGGRVHADRVIVRVHGAHRAGAAEAAIVFDGSRIDNLTVDGVRVQAQIDPSLYAARPTYAAMAAKARPLPGGLLTCTALGRGRCGAGYGGEAGIPIPGLGMLYVGEVVAKPGWRRLDMLRFVREPVVGNVQKDGGESPHELVVGACEGNGTEILP
jgi:hypothetical protein